MNDNEVAKDVIDDEHTDIKDKSEELLVEADEKILQGIGQSLDELNLCFDLEELNVLENENASPKDIEALKENLGPTVPLRLFSLANSTHFGRISSGKITKFTDVVTRLGTDFTRATAIFIAFLELANTDHTKMVMARNFATSKLAELIAIQMKVSTSNKNAVILGGLFIEIGQLIMLLYAHNEDIEMKEDFLQKYRARVGVMTIEKLELPATLIEIVRHSYFTFVEKNSFAPSAITDMAYRIVRESFYKHDKLVIRSAMPDPEGILYNSTAGSEILMQFDLMGLGKFVQVVPAELTEIEQRLIDKSVKN